MGFRRSFDSLFFNHEDFEFDKPSNLCVLAQALCDWGEQTLDLNCDTVVKVNQQKILLLDKYFEFFSVAPKQHRYHLGKTGHVCIFEVFLHFYTELKAIELSLTPPMLFLPPQPVPPPPPPPPPQIAGLIFGEPEDDEEW